MKRKNQKLVVISLIVLMLCAFTTTVIAMERQNTFFAKDTTDDTIIDDDTKAGELAKVFKKDKEAIKKYKAELKEWTKVYLKLIRDKKKEKGIGKERKYELYQQGYSYQNMDIADELAAIFDVNAEDILLAKGNARDSEVTVEYDKDGNQKTTVTDLSVQLWDETLSKLKYDMESHIQELGITKENVKIMKKSKITQLEIYELAKLILDFNKSFDEVWNEYLKGTGVKSLKAKYAKEIVGEGPKAIKQETDSSSVKEQIIKNAYKLTDEEIAMFNKNGITEMTDMAQAKHLAAKQNLSVDNVVEQWKKVKDWKKVNEQLGGEGQ